ncbi:Zn-ribbon domain containing protein [Bacillus phage Kirov]|uniref:Zn-ribbon domain containing protein n=1 Tax=Bacillus phage Kirov TaxID=2783539 RepID=A0A7U3NJX0_9CAUD|nr:Zn-ribbon domain containing protein [Bacillus phage Kirov]QOV08343.1 Zn-ribbon domain containing protein [Bacillus phage Kirov]
MKKQRWRFTKVCEFCTGCGKQMDARDAYAMRYGFCGVSCGYITFGMSWRDFY